MGIDEIPCQGAQLACMQSIMAKIGDFSHVDGNGERKKCLPACEDQTLHVLSLSSVLYQHQALSDEELCVLLPRLIQRCRAGSSKAKTLKKNHPSLCYLIDQLEGHEFCMGTVWNPPSSLNWLTGPLVETVEEYARHNLVKINIFFKDGHATRYMKEEKISRAQYLVNCGLLLCLGLGFSLLSIAELLYYVLSILASWVVGKAKKNAEN